MKLFNNYQVNSSNWSDQQSSDYSLYLKIKYNSN